MHVGQARLDLEGPSSSLFSRHFLQNECRQLSMRGSWYSSEHMPQVAEELVLEAIVELVRADNTFLECFWFYGLTVL